MNNISIPLEVVADLEPAMLAELADDSYARHRSGDLARATAQGFRSAPVSGTRLDEPGRAARRPRRSLLAGGVAVAAAASVAAVAVATAPAGRAPTPSARLDARSLLLTSADVAAHGAAAAGTYWYVRERDFEPTAPRSKSLTFGASFAATEESWTGQAGGRTIIGEDLTFSFASAADRARWLAAGSPKLAGPAVFGQTGPSTTNYKMTFRWGLGTNRLTLAGIRGLPTTAVALGKVLRRMWNREPDKAAAVGLPHPSFGQYLVAWADVLLTGPATPGTRAAIYQLLAGQPGISFVDKVTDPLGRAGDAVSDGGGDYLLIDPGTAQLLAYLSIPVHPRSVIRASAGVVVYEAMGWTSRLGIPAQR